MEDLIKFILLGVLTLPFAALVSDATGRTSRLFLRVAIGSTIISMMLALSVGGLHQRPNVANIFASAILVWPVLVLLAKAIGPEILWKDVWLSVPVMSWYLVNVSMQFYYPANGGGGGLGYFLGLAIGWFYMLVPFSILRLIFWGIQALTTQKGEQVATHNRDR